MGYMRHNAIIVTSWGDKAITEAAKHAKELGLQVLGPSDEAVNSYRSLLICPDGSKEGWPESEQGERRRAAFRGWLNAQRYEDGSTSLEWVESVYGSDDSTAAIADHAWKK